MANMTVLLVCELWAREFVVSKQEQKVMRPRWPHHKENKMQQMRASEKSDQQHPFRSLVSPWLIFACLFILLSVFTACASSSAAPPMLTVNPTRIDTTSAACSADNNRTCHSTSTVTLQNSGQSDLDWSATGNSLPPGWSASFNPSHGTLAASQTVQVQVSVVGGSCPAMAMLTFTGPANAVMVSWDCAENTQP